MADYNIELNRFAQDVCERVLEKFGVIKSSGVLRKANIYPCHDFLPRITRSVVTYALSMRYSFKITLEAHFKISPPTDERELPRFHEYLIECKNSFPEHWAENLCASLGACTEYIQFMSSKDIHVSLNKILIKWKDYFDKHIKIIFEEEGSFSKLYEYLENDQADQLDRFHQIFISEYCCPYGATEYTLENVEACIKKHSFNIVLSKTPLKSMVSDSNMATMAENVGPLMFSFLDQKDLEGLIRFEEIENEMPREKDPSINEKLSPPKVESSEKHEARISNDPVSSTSSPVRQSDASNLLP